MAIEEYFRVSELTDKTLKCQVKVRVTRRWTVGSKDSQDKRKRFDVVLIDERGDQIQAIVPKNHSNTFLNVLHEGHVYHIENFSVQTRRDSYRPIQHEFIILIRWDTIVRGSSEAHPEIPLYKFDFVEFDNVKLLSKANTNLKDAFGALDGASELMFRKGLMLKEIFLKNASSTFEERSIAMLQGSSSIERNMKDRSLRNRKTLSQVIQMLNAEFVELSFEKSTDIPKPSNKEKRSKRKYKKQASMAYSIGISNEPSQTSAIRTPSKRVRKIKESKSMGYGLCFQTEQNARNSLPLQRFHHISVDPWQFQYSNTISTIRVHGHHGSSRNYKFTNVHTSPLARKGGRRYYGGNLAVTEFLDKTCCNIFAFALSEPLSTEALRSCPGRWSQIECGDLQTKVKKLNNENNTLKTELLRLVEACQNIEMENSSIKLYGEELTSILENDQVEDGHSGVLNPERLDSGEGENKIRDCSGGSNSVSGGYQCCGLRLEHVNVTTTTKYNDMSPTKSQRHHQMAVDARCKRGSTVQVDFGTTLVLIQILSPHFKDLELVPVMCRLI
ncbi:hypothetical protein IFM89_028184 [Coptis chinensis]|uniref:Replication protein A 70 kDa DNA-binding subunit B/D first OB fold domain-containing protein n=1 Tax=Coptis chinensis TaxID=261450 RepID=A0A835I0I4_9MAGN|nr:hypothetical protein IFM89_028184 [Coptis chinensis]